MYCTSDTYNVLRSENPSKYPLGTLLMRFCLKSLQRNTKETGFEHNALYNTPAQLLSVIASRTMSTTLPRFLYLNVLLGQGCSTRCTNLIPFPFYNQVCNNLAERFKATGLALGTTARVAGSALARGAHSEVVIVPEKFCKSNHLVPEYAAKRCARKR